MKTTMCMFCWKGLYGGLMCHECTVDWHAYGELWMKAAKKSMAFCWKEAIG